LQGSSLIRKLKPKLQNMGKFLREVQSPSDEREEK
jgi:hypothetical protein